MVMSRMVTNVPILPCAKKTFILMDEGSFHTHVTGALYSANACDVGYVLDDGHVDLLGVLTET